MSDTLTFGGLTAYLGPGFQEPRIVSDSQVVDIPRANASRVIDQGKHGKPVTLNVFVMESDRASAQAELDSWQALEGSIATLSWSIDGNSDSTDNVLLLRAEASTRWHKTRAFVLSFIKVSE